MCHSYPDRGSVSSNVTLSFFAKFWPLSYVVSNIVSCKPLFNISHLTFSDIVVELGLSFQFISPHIISTFRCLLSIASCKPLFDISYFTFSYCCGTWPIFLVYRNSPYFGYISTSIEHCVIHASLFLSKFLLLWVLFDVVYYCIMQASFYYFTFHVFRSCGTPVSFQFIEIPLIMGTFRRRLLLHNASLFLIIHISRFQEMWNSSIF